MTIDDNQADHFLNVYHSASTVYAFCLNSTVQDKMAICLKTEIQEIDLLKANNISSTSLARTRSISSFGFGQDHHIDSYPDTEDDVYSSDKDQESINTAKHVPRKQCLVPSSKVSSSSTPIISPSRIITEDQNGLNIEHLHDSLRKSLAKGSDYSRTSPMPIDNSEREKMILLKRNIAASCAETHPKYPFCKMIYC
ncbi:uncharacterized protein BX663DRAFT_528299 [Cokeromyces recurvatus]|uniref:uncharacterized protein n=1 Tax=Cokeromyces recurvatus TaxID=90255 RepID=UPI00222017D6|nr:uncharacterized protein BX663DRAFT_528299 [Cokeromyces recurvatus]KAI7907429.1 hypothetical protein BX663DRAFT_528299 [Cokeromyces recurvatus]